MCSISHWQPTMEAFCRLRPIIRNLNGQDRTSMWSNLDHSGWDWTTWKSSCWGDFSFCLFMSSADTCARKRNQSGNGNTGNNMAIKTIHSQENSNENRQLSNELSLTPTVLNSCRGMTQLFLWVFIDSFIYKSAKDFNLPVIIMFLNGNEFQ